MNRFDKEVEFFSKFPKYGWIFPCSQCEQPVFKENYSRFICKQCKIQNKHCRTRKYEKTLMMKNDINQSRPSIIKKDINQARPSIIKQISQKLYINKKLYQN